VDGSDRDWPDLDWSAQRFEEHRAHLRAVAYRMLGSLTEADDAVQEAWLRLARADADDVQNLRGWLTTVVSRVCLDMLRSRASRREESLEVHVPDPVVTPADQDPQQHALLADSVGIALLVVLDTLSPPERLAFVLHDVFAVPFDDIGAVLDRSPAAAKQLASRARQRLRASGPAGAGQASAGPAGAGPGAGEPGAGEPGAGEPGRAGQGVPAAADRARQWEVVAAFQAASVAGDFAALLALLDPDVVLRADAGRSPLGPSRLLRGSHDVLAQALRFTSLAPSARRVLINGDPGFLVAPGGEPAALIAVAVRDDQITEINILADPDRLARLDLADVLG
jgi:RNA polymerase sigma factor (sigma-70 family)